MAAAKPEPWPHPEAGAWLCVGGNGLCLLQQGLRLELRGSQTLLNAKPQCGLAEEVKGRTARHRGITSSRAVGGNEDLSRPQGLLALGRGTQEAAISPTPPPHSNTQRSKQVPPTPAHSHMATPQAAFGPCLSPRL